MKPVTWMVKSLSLAVLLSTQTYAASFSGGNVDVTSSALPTGAATASKQDTGNSSLATIVTNTGGIATLITNTTGLATAANQSTANSALTTVNSNLSTLITNTTGLATETTLSSANSSLSTLVTNTGDANTKLDTIHTDLTGTLDVNIVSGGSSVTDATFSGNAFNQNDAVTSSDLNGASSVSFYVSGTDRGQLIPQVSSDGTHWRDTLYQFVNGTADSTDIDTAGYISVAGTYVADVSGAKKFRVIQSQTGTHDAVVSVRVSNSGTSALYPYFSFVNIKKTAAINDTLANIISSPGSSSTNAFGVQGVDGMKPLDVNVVGGSGGDATAANQVTGNDYLSTLVDRAATAENNFNTLLASFNAEGSQASGVNMLFVQGSDNMTPIKISGSVSAAPVNNGYTYISTNTTTTLYTGTSARTVQNLVVGTAGSSDCDAELKVDSATVGHYDCSFPITHKLELTVTPTTNVTVVTTGTTAAKITVVHRAG